jgi:hypothetical protein
VVWGAECNCVYGDISQQVFSCDLLYCKGCGVLILNCVYDDSLRQVVGSDLL